MAVATGRAGDQGPTVATNAASSGAARASLAIGSSIWFIDHRSRSATTTSGVGPQSGRDGPGFRAARRHAPSSRSTSPIVGIDGPRAGAGRGQGSGGGGVAHGIGQRRPRSQAGGEHPAERVAGSHGVDDRHDVGRHGGDGRRRPQQRAPLAQRHHDRRGARRLGQHGSGGGRIGPVGPGQQGQLRLVGHDDVDEPGERVTSPTTGAGFSTTSTPPRRAIAAAAATTAGRSSSWTSTTRARADDVAQPLDVGHLDVVVGREARR